MRLKKNNRLTALVW